MTWTNCMYVFSFLGIHKGSFEQVILGFFFFFWEIKLRGIYLTGTWTADTVFVCLNTLSISCFLRFLKDQCVTLLASNCSGHSMWSVPPLGLRSQCLWVPLSLEHSLSPSPVKTEAETLCFQPNIDIPCAIFFQGRSVWLRSSLLQ